MTTGEKQVAIVTLKLLPFEDELLTHLSRLVGDTGKRHFWIRITAASGRVHILDGEDLVPLEPKGKIDQFHTCRALHQLGFIKFDVPPDSFDESRSFDFTVLPAALIRAEFLGKREWRQALYFVKLWSEDNMPLVVAILAVLTSAFCNLLLVLK